MTNAVNEIRSCRPMRMAAGMMMAGLAVLLIGGALAADQDWFDRHFLPVFFLSRDQYVLGERLFRAFVGALGLALLLLMRPVSEMVARIAPRALVAHAMRIALAIALALTVAELVMRRTFSLAAAEGPRNEEPLRRPDARLGWSFVPSRSGHAIVGGREITYTIDLHGYRVRSPDRPVDFHRPSIIFTGESIIAGFGLNWDETIPATVESLTKVQSANIAVFGFANDQAYLRLKSELPNFREPVAVVSLFIPSLFVRNLDDDRPHLGPHLSWLPGVPRARLHALMNFLIPYHSVTSIDRGIGATRETLLASAALAHARHAQALVIVPQFGPEGPVERMIRHRVLDYPSINYVQVPLPASWRIKGDLHPDPRAAHAIAVAIAEHLRQRWAGHARSDGAQVRSAVASGAAEDMGTPW